MVPGGSNIQGRFVRQISTWISFAAVYLPSWIVVGIVISASCFPKTSLGIPVGFTITTGLALTSFGLFGASCFRKSQLSGSIIGIIALLFAILPISLANQTQGTALLLSFLCPSAAFTYFVTTAASFEAAKIGLVMWKLPPDSGDFRINVGVLWLILVVQILVFPILAFLVEHLLFSTASSSRVFATPSNPGGPTITLLGFAKT
jgi:ATP-binding cassette subfamily A (ABC1) protein 3